LCWPPRPTSDFGPPLAAHARGGKVPPLGPSERLPPRLASTRPPHIISMPPLRRSPSGIDLISPSRPGGNLKDTTRLKDRSPPNKARADHPEAGMGIVTAVGSGG